MQIKTQEGEKNVASQALAGTALGLAIPGTLSFLGNILGGGMLLANGVNGGNCNCNVAYGNNYMQRNTTEDTRLIGSIFAELMKEKSERYADNNGTALYKELAAKINADNAAQDAKFMELAKAVAAIDKQQAVDKKEIECNFAFLNNRITETAKELRCYVDATFVPGKLVMPLSSICPPAQAATTTTATTAE
jgi:hypothetical protein|nr:MAG TPA: hypothetical protein [Caudoviricetes sp.]